MSKALFSAAAAAAAAAAMVISAAGGAVVDGKRNPPPPSHSSETLSNIPQLLWGGCAPDEDCRNKSSIKEPRSPRIRIQRPRSNKAESCTVKCVTTCIRGSNGEGPFNVRRPLVVFKQGFRSRQYCLVECTDICNLIGDNDDGL